MRMNGKVVLITAAARGIPGELMGIGGAAAWLLSREGANVVLTDIDKELGEETAAQIRENSGVAMFLRLDVTKEQDWINAIQMTVSRYGKLDVLVNCAGPGKSHLYSLEDTPEKYWDREMDSHAKAIFLGTKHVIPEMRKIGGGSIVNISSIYGIVSSPLGVAYGSAKGAIRMFSKAAAIQYAKDNIRVNSVHPGYVHTNQMRQMIDDPEKRKWLLDRTPIGRLAVGCDIAYGILYLASDESSFVTGSELVIDGGVTAQ